VYAELDTNITASAPAVVAALETAGVPHDFVVEPGANHAFFNDTGERYNPHAATTRGRGRWPGSTNTSPRRPN
jgi:carboxymethylenebutenolidase